MGHRPAEDRLHQRSGRVPRDAGDDPWPADGDRAARFVRQVFALRRRGTPAQLARCRRRRAPDGGQHAERRHLIAGGGPAASPISCKKKPRNRGVFSLERTAAVKAAYACRCSPSASFAGAGR
ncbi:hypothetical protein EMIT0111MI5_220056 [Burkholderia sp. IT-111MI5]